MSRRQRKKTSTRKKEKNQACAKFKRLWWKLLLGLIALLVAGVFFAYNRVVAFLHSDDFREDISVQVGAEIGGVVTFSDFKWDGLSARNNRFESAGDGAIASIDARDIALDVRLDYFKRDKFRLENVNVGSVDLLLDLRRDFLTFDKVEKEKGFIESLLPDEVELLDAEIGAINATVYADSGDYTISGVKLQTTKDVDGYNATINGGIVNLPFSFLNSARLEQGKISQMDEEIYIKNTKLKIFKSGTITLNGVIDLAQRARYLYDMKGELSGLRCKDIFPDDWHRHLAGEVRGKFKIKPHQGTEPKILGSLEIIDGTLQALPILNKVSYYLAEPKYRTLKFQKFECDFEKFRDQTHLRNIVLSSRELVKIEGDLKIDGNNIDGLFDVGVPAFYLDKIPGAKTSVFKPGRDQLLWTKVKIGGDFDDITEDLSNRLLMAATEEMIRRALSMGGEAINPKTLENLIKGGEGAFKNLEGVLKGDKGVIESGVDTAKELLEGITGAKKEKKEGEKKDGGLIPDLNKLLPFF